ncbi:MAG: YerC/YecD family TrpR-related protein [Patescibacteria group bacterium]|nr:YerC/YecD family TrpR-related protein [Patescibacteria group bacterium]
MAKFAKTSKLSENEREHLLMIFFESLASVRNPAEAAKVFSDLLSPSELDMLAKRLAVARALLEGDNYQSIGKNLKVSTNTIARVSAWIHESGEGYRLIFKRVRGGSSDTFRKNNGPLSVFTSLKRSYPQYFWPQLLLERVVASANRRNKEELRAIIKKAKNKNRLLTQIDKILKNEKNYHTI